MPFRRQDIPKTTRAGGEGQPRRLYPRFAKDRSLLPKIELAIAYLDGMVGRRRGDLSPDAVLDLFGDPKLARCLLACLADRYRYRTPTFAEVVGENAALALAAWDLLTPADLRAHVYRAANAMHGGFVPPADRAAFLAEVARPLALTEGQFEELLHLDAERNALLVRVGPRPRAEDVLARYNVTLALSVLRHASEVSLALPGLDGRVIEAVCERHAVPCRLSDAGQVRLFGRRSTLGTWGQFGGRVARCALQLLLLCPRTPSGAATVHLNGHPLAFVLDGFVVGALRPPVRLAAGPAEMATAEALSEEIAALRRKTGGRMNGWTVRRPLEPIVVAGAIVLPELLFARDLAAVPLAPLPAGMARLDALLAAERVRAARPLVALDPAGEAPMPRLDGPDPVALVDLLDGIADEPGAGRSPLALVAEEAAARGWVGVARLAEVLGGPEERLEERLRPLVEHGTAEFVPGVGLCAAGLIDDLVERLAGRPLDVVQWRAAIAERIGHGASADALTLHLLARHAVLTSTGFGGRRAA